MEGVSRLSRVLTAESFTHAMEALSKRPKQPSMLIVSPWVRLRMDYILRTVTVWELPGYMRRRGPDGKTWIEKKRPFRCYGKGNKARRRMGLPPVADDGWNDE